MIIESSDQVSRFKFLKRFPIPRNFKIILEFRIETGHDEVHHDAIVLRILVLGRAI